jgi:hypothetical protein
MLTADPTERVQGLPNLALERHQQGPDASFHTQSGAYAEARNQSAESEIQRSQRFHNFTWL